MFGLDERVAALSSGDALLVVIGVAILLGLRHATDPDHLTAVSTLIASERERSARRAARMGFAWGLGHATTLFIFGLPIVLFQQHLPEWTIQIAEAMIGAVIAGLATRLLLRWRRGRFHTTRSVPHHHLPAATRAPIGAYAIGLLHGVGGSAGVGILLLAAIPSQAVGVVALLLFAVCTAISMSLASSGFGFAMTRDSVQRGLGQVTPVLGGLSLAFGVWYGLGAVDAVPYVF